MCMNIAPRPPWLPLLCATLVTSISPASPSLTLKVSSQERQANEVEIMFITKPLDVRGVCNQWQQQDKSPPWGPDAGGG